MDNYTSGGIGASIVLALGIAYRIYTAINHRRVRSTCCGKELSASIDVETTTPPAEKSLRINSPPPVECPASTTVPT
jgi:hypothetical protein